MKVNMVKKYRTQLIIDYSFSGIKGLQRTNLRGFDNEGFIPSTRNDPA